MTEFEYFSFKLIKRVKFIIIVGDDWFSVRTIFPVSADRDDFKKINKFKALVTLINSDHDGPGHFYFDEKNGEIVFRCKFSYKDNEDYIPIYLSYAPRMMDLYSPEILGIISNYLALEDVRHKKWSYQLQPLSYWNYWWKP